MTQGIPCWPTPAATLLVIYVDISLSFIGLLSSAVETVELFCAILNDGGENEDDNDAMQALHSLSLQWCFLEAAMSVRCCSDVFLGICND